MKPLIKEDGQPFSDAEVQDASARLNGLDAAGKLEFRNMNADAIAKHDSSKMLIVSGPGTGKSFLFRSKLKHWLATYPSRRVAVATFVRKLMRDLEADIAGDDEITAAGKTNVDIFTLHQLARSIIERNRGTKAVNLGPHCLIVTPEEREEMVWRDVLCMNPAYKPDKFPWQELKDGLYDAEPPTEAGWLELRRTHQQLQSFYNAISFPDLILLATEAVNQNATLTQDTMFIIDEFQDFNLAEDGLIGAITQGSSGLLLVGDDDQVLYDKLRRGHPSIIRAYYRDSRFTKAMLPFCVRSDFHICKVAEGFLSQGRSPESIAKVFVPIGAPDSGELVRVVASTTPKVAVEYVESLLATHDAGIRQRQIDIDSGDLKDPYLLILTPAKEMRFLGSVHDRFMDALAPYLQEDSRPGDDYWRVHDYYSSATNPAQNYHFRKVLDHEDTTNDLVCDLLRKALETRKNFTDLNHEAISSCRSRCVEVRKILDAEHSTEVQVEMLQGLIAVNDPVTLRQGVGHLPRDLERAVRVRHPV